MLYPLLLGGHLKNNTVRVDHGRLVTRMFVVVEDEVLDQEQDL